jgi:hypothetical protein
MGKGEVENGEKEIGEIGEIEGIDKQEIGNQGNRIVEHLNN